MKLTEDLLNELIITLQENLKESKECMQDDYILVFESNNLAVHFNENNLTSVTSVARASTVAYKDSPEECYAYIPDVYNGNKEYAKLILRQVALRKEQVALRKDINRLEEMLKKLSERI